MYINIYIYEKSDTIKIHPHGCGFLHAYLSNRFVLLISTLGSVNIMRDLRNISYYEALILRFVLREKIQNILR